MDLHKITSILCRYSIDIWEFTCLFKKSFIFLPIHKSCPPCSDLAYKNYSNISKICPGDKFVRIEGGTDARASNLWSNFAVHTTRGTLPFNTRVQIPRLLIYGKTQIAHSNCFKISIFHFFGELFKFFFPTVFVQLEKIDDNWQRLFLPHRFATVHFSGLQFLLYSLFYFIARTVPPSTFLF